MNIAAIRDECEKDPAYKSGNAFERTQIVCNVLTRMGESLPAWTAIREIIEKGSSGDINRGKAAFRMAHAAELKRLGSVPDGVPDVLAPVIRRLWELSLDQAQSALADRERASEEQVQQAVEAAEQALGAMSQANSDRDLARAEVEALKSTVASLTASVEAERAGRLSAEDIAASARQDAARQREEMAQMLDSTRSELRSAVSRLEGAEKHSLREIERNRGESQREIDRLKSTIADLEASHLKHERERDALSNDLAQKVRQLHATEMKLATAEAKLSGRERLPMVNPRKKLVKRKSVR